ncbi:MAG TPA: HAMP domain-containing protein, partial [Thermoanaerobaculia bacterium]|nr:HAMP domain-containing protein [Thermoanaerobaculia bacterium]
MTASSSSRFRLPLFAAWVLLGALAWLLDWLGERFELGIVSFLGGLAFACWVLLASVALFRIVWRRVFWSTGRRLAFSYVLVGILPLLLVASIVLVAAYMLSGFLLGHLSRDAVGLFRDDLEAMALARLADEPTAADHEVPGGLIRFADYRRGRRSGGVEVAPEIWPAWLGAAQAERRDRTAEESRRPFLALEDGRLTVAAVAGGPQRGSLAWFEGDLQEALRRRTGTWLELFRADDPRKLPVVRITLLGETLQIRGLRELQDPQDLATFYRLSPPRRPGEPAWRERPWIVWMEQAGSVRALRTGEEVTEGVAISLAASPAGLFRSLLSASEQTDSTAWLVLAGFAVLLLEIWAAAAGVALFMIFGLSRAVNRLSRGTEAVARGDFSVRIPARRRDQLGDLQRSYNAMAEHLSELVETAAQKEALDKELALARQVQEDLLPDEISPRKGLEIATHFEPSSAIGGDYFDVLERPEG